MKHVLDPENHDLDKWLADHGQPAFRGRQIRKWLFEKRAGDFHDMTDLPLPLREQLICDFSIWTTRIADRSQAADGTEKLLLDLADGRSVECVLLRDGQRRSICVSTQVGCVMGCDFCASGLGGVDRNLTAGEIVEQMLQLGQLLPADERLSHIVVMGMGEPLANLDALLPALQEASRKDGLGISVRRITISTVGLPAAIDRLAKRDSRYHLAVSLHAPNDTLRNRLVPINQKTGLAKTLAAADRYFETSGRRLTFEYVLLAGVNDQPEHAHELAALLRGRAALLNLIPYNRVTGLPYQTPTPAAQRRFREILEQAGLAVKIRQRKGDMISAACGQLRRSAHGVENPKHEIRNPKQIRMTKTPNDENKRSRRS